MTAPSPRSGRPMIPTRRGAALVPLRGGKPALESDAESEAEVARAAARRVHKSMSLKYTSLRALNMIHKSMSLKYDTQVHEP